jgi:hypothetical protein
MEKMRKPRKLPEQIADKLDKGLLDFLVLAELPDSRKYEYLPFRFGTS